MYFVHLFLLRIFSAVCAWSFQPISVQTNDFREHYLGAHKVYCISIDFNNQKENQYGA